ncbi:uncharacterized protein [Parasteatoda tepidariorum]|uniref:uncharacterized protein n=1 Tax=Parasteatoda tepidariorum TaxID=114398 RepID=UPI0039BCCFF4
MTINKNYNIILQVAIPAAYSESNEAILSKVFLNIDPKDEIHAQKPKEEDRTLMDDEKSTSVLPPCCQRLIEIIMGEKKHEEKKHLTSNSESQHSTEPEGMAYFESLLEKMSVVLSNQDRILSNQESILFNQENVLNSINTLDQRMAVVEENLASQSSERCEDCSISCINESTEIVDFGEKKVLYNIDKSEGISHKKDKKRKFWNRTKN